MLDYGYTAEKLAAEREEVANLRTLQKSQHREIGDAQQATQAKWDNFSKLKAWCDHLSEVARIEFEDDAQYLEKPGLLVRS